MEKQLTIEAGLREAGNVHLNKYYVCINITIIMTGEMFVVANEEAKCRWCTHGRCTGLGICVELRDPQGGQLDRPERGRDNSFFTYFKILFSVLATSMWLISSSPSGVPSPFLNTYICTLPPCPPFPAYLPLSSSSIYEAS